MVNLKNERAFEKKNRFEIIFKYFKVALFSRIL